MPDKLREDKFVGGDEEADAIMKLLDPSITTVPASNPDDEDVILGVATGEDYDPRINPEEYNEE